MKSVAVLGVSALIVAGILLIGCDEWTTDTDDWNESQISVTYFSGRYAHATGQVLVQNSTTNVTVSNVESDRIATGDGVRYQFVAQLSHRPIVIGSLTITDGTVNWFENGNGTLAATIANAAGTIDYSSGEVTLDYALPGNAPAAGAQLIASYKYRTQRGSSDGPIYSFVVSQDGNHLTFTDDHGNHYVGAIGHLEVIDSPAVVGPWSAIASFSVEGTYNGQQIQIVGTLEGEVDDDADPAVLYRYLYGTWIESGGETGTIRAQAEPITYYENN